MTKPVIGISAGDPNGIGPEIVLKALVNKPEIYQHCQPVVFCDPQILKYYAGLLHLNELNFYSSDSAYSASQSAIIYAPGIPDFTEKPSPGKLSGAAGMHATACIKSSIQAALEKQITTVVTAPINKEALQAAKLPFLDHTQMFTELTSSRHTMTLFVTGPLRIFFLTRHLAFKDIVAALDSRHIADTLKYCDRYLRRIGITDPHIAVAALNPHGGESGLFGDEETEIIGPAVQQAVENGLRVSGPVPADSVFHLNLEGTFDAVLSLYHDQGHIAAKTYDFYGTVSLTMGLPFLRTSVDHGTAFDLAGKGQANERSMVEAILAASKYGW